MKPLIFAACDVGYYNLYGKALQNSAVANGMECLIHCTGKMVDSERSKVEHNVLRYLMLPDLLKKCPAILVLDTDSIINEPIEINDKYDVGLFLRLGYTDIRKKTMGSAFYITDRATDFADDLKRRMSNIHSWFDDQAAIYKSYQKYFNRYKFKIFGPSFINWHCLPAPIWTGKGKVKSNSIAYMALQARWEGVDGNGADRVAQELHPVLEAAKEIPNDMRSLEGAIS